MNEILPCAVAKPPSTSWPARLAAQWLSRMLVVVLTGATLLTITSFMVGCDEGVKEETRIFEEAEALYRAGDYDGATARYEAFLETYPRSPFAKTARLRLATIDREVESVMGTSGANRPIFIRPTDSDEIIAESLDGKQEPGPANGVEGGADAPAKPASDDSVEPGE